MHIYNSIKSEEELQRSTVFNAQTRLPNSNPSSIDAHDADTYFGRLDLIPKNNSKMGNNSNLNKDILKEVNNIAEDVKKS